MQALIEKSESLDAFACDQDLLDDILAGLGAPTKSLSPKYFYDEHGSQLFEKITQLPEYYPPPH
jgi:L-histidine N-alpha-methyltransferase